MKKFYVVLAAILLSLAIVGSSYAASTEAINPEAEPFVSYWKKADGSILAQSPETMFELAPTVYLNISPTGYTNFSNPGNYNRMAAYIKYDETETGGGVQETITVQVSPDNINWQTAGFYDYAGGATAQTSETISTDGNYYLYTNPNVPAQYARLYFSATNVDANDTIVNTVYTAQKY